MMFTALVVLVAVAASEAAILPFLQPPKHDGVKRVCTLTSENFTSVVSTTEIAVVIFQDPLAQPSTVKSTCPCETDNFAELTAQILRKKNIIVCTAPANIVDAATAAKATAPAYNPGDVYIYKNGKGKPYYGRRSASAVVGFLFQVNTTNVSPITGKIEKIAFDAVQETKVVGFFMQNTPDYLAYQEAAAALSPSVRFYAVYDRVVAKHLKMDTVGQIHLVKPFSKTPLLCPQNPATAADIEAFVTQTKGALLTKIDKHNLYDPNLLDASRTLVLAIGEETSAVGGYFYHLVTKLVRNNTNNTEFEKMNIVWVEPKIFPTIHLMMDELETTLGIPNKLPAFGTVNVTTLQSSWLDTTTLNTTADKTADEQNLLLLQDFLNGVINNTIVPVKIGAQAFVTTPTAQVVEAGSEVILECVIENKVGDCLWLKDGRNIGFNLARYPFYDWRGDTTVGDCSLRITEAQNGRDNGEWTCEVTGDLESPTLTSQPAKLVISASTAQTIKTEL